MRNLLKLLFSFTSKCLSVLNKFISKRNTFILFYADPAYNDNVRALFQYCLENNYQSKYRLYSTVRINQCKDTENVFFISRMRALFIFLKAKYVFYDVGTTRIKPTSKQIVVQLWHGTPLKKIGRSVSKSSDRINDFSFVITTADSFIEIFKNAFGCSSDQVKVFEYPRNEFLFKPDYSVMKSYQKKTYKKNILWMPTFRNSRKQMAKFKMAYDTLLPMFSTENMLNELNNFLSEKDFFLTVKLHPAAVENEFPLPSYSNIKIFNNNMYSELGVQNYSFVSCFDVLITDYSSVYFDWLLLDRPLAFTINDISDYNNKRGFVFDNPLDYMPGEIIQTPQQFYDFLCHVENQVDTFSDFRHRVRSLSHTNTIEHGICKALLDDIGIFI